MERLTDKLVEAKRSDGRTEVGTVIKDYRSCIEVAFLDGREDIKRNDIIKIHD